MRLQPGRSRGEDERYDESRMMFWFMFFIVGTVNNLGTVLVNTSAKDLAAEFGKESWMPSFQM